jgi:hypothetical protein
MPCKLAWRGPAELRIFLMNNEAHQLNKLARLGLSFVGGIAITFFLVLLGMLLTYRNIGFWLLATLLYWPMDVMSRSGIGPDCANADLVSEKLNCIALSFGVDVIFYSLLVFLALTMRRRQVQLR